MMRTRITHLAAKITLTVFAWVAVACHRSEPDEDHPRIAPGVAMKDVNFYSPALGRDMSYRVFLPEKIDVGVRLPVVYLLHGNGGEYRDWSNYSDVSQYALPGPGQVAASGLILVMIEGHSSYFMNAVEKPKDRYQDYILHDLLHDVEARFPASGEPGQRAIVGVSMGGFAAVEFALSHPGIFVFAGAISPAIDVTERRFSWKRIRQWAGFREIFGPFGSPQREASDPFRLARTTDPKAAPFFYLTAGQQEPLLAPVTRFAARLRQQGIAHAFYVHPGGHDWAEWNTQIPGCFASLAAHLEKPGRSDERRELKQGQRTRMID